MFHALRPGRRVFASAPTAASRLLVSARVSPRSPLQNICRNAFQNASRPQRTYQTINIQRVKVRRKWFKPKSILVAIVIYYMCWQVYTDVLLGVIRRYLDSLSEEELAEIMEDEDDEPLLFIPIPGTTRMEKGDWYRADDPEWQTFVRVSKDKNYLHRVESSLIELCGRSVASSRWLTARWGKDVTLSRKQLSVNFPARAPPFPVRSGISWEEDGVYIVDEEMDPETNARLQRALFPSVLGISLWSFVKTLGKQHLDSATRVLGYDSESKPVEVSAQQSLEKAQQTIDKAHQRLKGDTGTKRNQADSSLPTPPQSDQASDVAASSAVGKASESTKNAKASLPSTPGAADGAADDDKEKSWGLYFPSVDIDEPAKSFFAKLSSLWRPLRWAPPRGSFALTGMIEYELPRAFVALEVFAFYDPEARDFHKESLHMRIHSLQPKRQSPRP